MKTLAILLGEHPCIVNILFGPTTVHYREVLLYAQNQPDTKHPDNLNTTEMDIAFNFKLYTDMHIYTWSMPQYNVSSGHTKYD